MSHLTYETAPPRAAAEPAGASAASVDERIRIMLVISSLEHGGAERQVLALAEHLDPSRFETLICSLSAHLPLAGSLPPRIPIHLIPKRWRFDATVVPRLASLMRRHRVDLVHSFLFDADMAARLAARLAPVRAVIGSERNSDYRFSLSRSVAGMLTRNLVHAVVANSHAGKRFSEQSLRLPASRVHVVHNGVDTDRFRPRPAEHLRQALGLAPLAPVIGMVANFKRQKNHEMFLRVAGRILASRPDARFVAVGGAVQDGHGRSEAYQQEVRQLARTLGIADHIIWLGLRDDMPDIYNLLDVAVLTSRHEGTPNVLLEAMASGVPSVVTGVADNSVHVREGVTGFVVPLDDDLAMTDRVLALLEDRTARDAMGRAARERAVANYSLARMAQETASVYRRVLDRVAARDAGGRGR